MLNKLRTFGVEGVLLLLFLFPLVVRVMAAQVCKVAVRVGVFHIKLAVYSSPINISLPHMTLVERVTHVVQNAAGEDYVVDIHSISELHWQLQDAKPALQDAKEALHILAHTFQVFAPGLFLLVGRMFYWAD